MSNEKRLDYRITGEGRKRLVKAVAEFKETFSEYCGAPTFAYKVDEITIDKAGALIFPDDTDEKEIEELAAYLESRGFSICCNGEQIAQENALLQTVINGTENATEEAGTETAGVTGEDTGKAGTNQVIIEMPREGFTEETLSNLQKLIGSKASLLKKSLGTDDLSIELIDDRIRFPWLKDTDSMYVAACTKLIAAICKMAKETKRVTATDREVESEKYAFRTWLLRLGFIGAEYKNDRAILMKNLSGTAAFKNAADAQAFADRQKAKRKAAITKTEE